MSDLRSLHMLVYHEVASNVKGKDEKGGDFLRRTNFDPGAVFQPPRNVAEITGLSLKHIRDGCAKGSIPCIRVGVDYRVNVPLFLEQLNEASRKGASIS